MTETDIDRMPKMISAFKDEIKGEFQQQLTVQREDFQKQRTFVGEGFQMLSEKIDRMETRLDKRMDCLEHKLDAVAAETSGHTVAIRDLTHKVDAVAADLSAHRADTEAHPPVY
jgi:ABC-type phosphate transport system auxiliary subunit